MLARPVISETGNSASTLAEGTKAEAIVEIAVAGEAIMGATGAGPRGGGNDDMLALRPSADLVGEYETTEDPVWPDIEPAFFRIGRSPGSVTETGLAVLAVLILSGGRAFCPGTTSGAFLEPLTTAGLPGRLAEAFLVDLG